MAARKTDWGLILVSAVMGGAAVWVVKAYADAQTKTVTLDATNPGATSTDTGTGSNLPDLQGVLLATNTTPSTPNAAITNTVPAGTVSPATATIARSDQLTRAIAAARLAQASSTSSSGSSSTDLGLLR